ncbi:MAG TPA: hypothetical protein VK431_04250, partial [Nitrosopumilaceae archaeon]|nr:hypothetical protein [Nitrosopumilaceae archaeon]
MLTQHPESENLRLHLDIKKKEIVIQSDLLLEDGVEYLAIINKNGKIEDATYKNDINLIKEKKEMFSMGLRLQNSMQHDFDEEFGPVNYTITSRENSNFISIPTSAGILVAKLDKSIHPFEFIHKISAILNVSERSPET